MKEGDNMFNNIFISMPMSGKTREEIEKEMEEIKQFIKDTQVNDWGVFNTQDVPLIIDEPLADHERYSLQCLAKSLEMLAEADLIIMAKGWQRARGCVIEHECAVRYLNIPIIYM